MAAHPPPEVFGVTAAEWRTMGAWTSEPSEIQLLLLASFAYFDGANVSSHWDAFGFQAPPTHAFFSFDPYQGFGLVHGNDIVLGFRGTELVTVKEGALEFIKDWVTNFDFSLTPFQHGRVHRGFLNAVNNLWPQVNRFVQENFVPGRRIYVVGHSQGAALAVLATAKLLADATARPLTMCVFAPPMVGNQAFVEWMESEASQRGCRLVRFTNSRDPVPLVPPTSFVTPYYPGPGTHVHLRSHDDVNQRIVSTGGMDAFYHDGLPNILVFPFWLARHTLDARFHFPAGPELLPGNPASRPGYLPCLRASL